MSQIQREVVWGQNLQSTRWARNYSTLATTRRSVENLKLNPLWVTGFVDGEGCFTIWVTKNSRYKQGWLVQVSFQITLHKKDQELLKWIQIYFKGVGNITKQGENYINYRVKNIEGLKLIINHFDSYPLKTQKQGDFVLLKRIFYLMLKKEHLTNEGLLKIVEIKASMNLGLSDDLKVAFPNIISQERPLVETNTIDNLDWLAGFTSAEDCFMVKIKASQTITGYAVHLEFQVTQHMRDEQLIRSLIKYFECGNIQKNAENFDFRVIKITDITTKIIPFFKKHHIQGVKAWDFSDFCKVAEMMEKREHLTAEGLEKIREIKAGMNRGRNN